MPAIMPSMAAGSDRGLGADVGASPLGGPSFKYVPALKASERDCEIAL